MHQIKNGISFLPDCYPQEKSAYDYYNDAKEVAIYAESAGFSFIKMTEHYFHSYGGNCPSPLNFFSWLALATKNIRFISGGVLPVFHNPLQLASVIAQTQILTGDRLDIGFARAFLPYEFEAFGYSLDESRDLFSANVREIVRVLGGDNNKIPLANLENARIFPVKNNEQIDFWVTCVNARQSFAWTGENGFGLLVSPSLSDSSRLKENIDIYRASFRSQKKAELPRVAMSVPLFVDRDRKKAKARGSLYLSRYHAVFLDAITSWRNTKSSAYPGYERMFDKVKGLSPEHLIESNAVFIGDREEVKDLISIYREKYGVDIFLWQVDFGGQAASDSINSLEILMELS